MKTTAKLLLEIELRIRGLLVFPRGFYMEIGFKVCFISAYFTECTTYLGDVSILLAVLVWQGTDSGLCQYALRADKYYAAL